MAFFKTFYDMTGSTSYTTHTIGSFDANCSSGGGTFRWIDGVPNVSITNIPGIRIKPTKSTVGYWERVYDGPINVGWFGCQNTTTTPLTFAQLGISQGTLNIRYGTGFATTADYYDTTAVRYALQYMSTINNQSLIFEPKEYWLSRACTLPTKITTNPMGRNMFVINGNGAMIRKVGTAQFNFFERIPADTTVDDQYIDTSFVFENFTADGAGGVWQNSGYAFLFLGASYGSIITNIHLKNFDYGLRLEFCMNTVVSEVFTNNITSYSVILKNGSWTGSGLSNSSSNVSEVNHVRVFNDSLNQIAGIAIIDADTCVVRQCIVEGTGTPQYGILWDSLNSTVTPNGRVEDCHIETVCTKAAVFVIPRSSTNIIVDNMYIQYAQNIVGQQAAAFPSTVYPKVTIMNIPYWPTGTKFLNIGTGNRWDLRDIMINSYLTTDTQIVCASSTSAVASASGSGSLVTYTTSAPHSFCVGQRITVTGLTPSGYNVTNGVITTVGSSTFTVAGSTTGASSGTGSATQGQLWDTTTANGTIPSASNVDWKAPL